MSEATDHRAAEYVLGLLSPEDRAAVEREAAADPALADEIAFWNDRLSPLLDAGEVRPPPDLFYRVQAAIDARAHEHGNALPGTLTIRTDEGQWEPLAPGFERKMLSTDGPNGRVTFLVRGEPGARFPAHEHPDDEECYVIEGDLTFDTLTLQAGDYHRAHRGQPHPGASTEAGCLLLITAAAAS
jgi:quercetin dioxygenase-like cupin family protein